MAKTIVIPEVLTRKERIERTTVAFDPAPYQEFIDKMNLGEFTVSFSAIKEFSISPLTFLRYKTGLKKQTDSMKMGRLEHCLILEPQKFDDEFTTLVKAEDSKNWGSNLNKAAKIEQELNAEMNNKTIVKDEDIEKALKIKEDILGNSMAGQLIEGCTHFESSHSIEMFDLIWNMRIDGRGSNYIIDLKKVADARPSKLRWIQKERKFPWQAFLNKRAFKHSYDWHFYNICYDGSGNVSVIRQSDYDMMLAEAEIKEACEELQSCIIGESWNHSLEFYTEQGYYESSEI